jgi:hypothetical protein
MNIRFPSAISIAISLAFVISIPAVRAGGVVSSCNEAALLAALDGGGTVTFGCNGVIVLTEPIFIAEDTVVDGSNHTVTISGNDAVSVFSVTNKTLTLKALTIANGRNTSEGGGGVSAFGGTVNVDHSTLKDNSAYDGAVYCKECTLNVSHSTFSGNICVEEGAMCYGGGISTYPYGNVTVSDSTFSGNVAITGGAIFSNCSPFTPSFLSVTRSTFTNNVATEWGGGAIGTCNEAVVSNSTFYGNSAAEGNYDSVGGAIANAGPLTVINSTFWGNSGYDAGGIYNNDYNDKAEVLLQNSIIANSTRGANCYGNITDGGGNLSYPDTSCGGINADPLLGPLQDNGGPTFTMAPDFDSPALESAVDAICAEEPVYNLDQRGVVRPGGSHCDIGAVEEQYPPTLVSWPIDIKPGSKVNPINPTARGNVSVAILTSEYFNALDVNPQTVSFGPYRAVAANKRDPAKDVDADGDTDLVLHFRVGDTGLTCVDDYAWLIGRTYDGELFKGVDAIRTVGCQRSTRSHRP